MSLGDVEGAVHPLRVGIDQRQIPEKGKETGKVKDFGGAITQTEDLTEGDNPWNGTREAQSRRKNSRCTTL